jgi:hypothetical protein
MRVVRCTRDVLLPGWAAVIVALWGLGVLAIYLHDQAGGVHTPLCFFRRLTGIPCATCNGTHAAMALSRGEVMKALRLNPLVVTGGLLLGAWAAARLAGGRTIALTAGERGFALGCAALAVAANWAYVIVRGM